jgi:hypothetical protein
LDAGIPQNSGFGDGTANAAAEANWDANNDLSTSQEWVEIHRDSAETDTGITATPAAPSNVQSWADDQPESPEVRKSFHFARQLLALFLEFSFVKFFSSIFANFNPIQVPPIPAANPNDGFHEVKRGGNRGDGQGRARGGRGRGVFRGDGQGRSRGGRGRGSFRGSRRPDES